MAGTERASVVTTAKRPAMRLAAWNAASPMPTTGAAASARAASSPVSSKQAMTCALTPCASPFAISASRPGAARSAARRILSVIETVVFGLTTRMSIPCLGSPAPQRSDQQERYQDHGERHAGRHRAEGVDLGIGHGRREAGQLERQRVLIGAQRLARARRLVPREREAEEGYADERGRDEGQHHVAERLARRRAEVAGGLLVAVVEAVEDGEHDEQPEGQRPREMGAEPRRERAGARRESLDEAGEADALRRPPDQRVEEAELDGDPERDDDRGHDQARHRRVEDEGRAAEAPPERVAREQRDEHGERHDDRAQLQRPSEGRPYVDHAEAAPQTDEPVRGDAVQGKRQAARRSLERQYDDRQHRTVEEQDEQAEDRRERVEGGRPSPGHGLRAPGAGRRGGSSCR